MDLSTITFAGKTLEEIQQFNTQVQKEANAFVSKQVPILEALIQDVVGSLQELHSKEEVEQYIEDNKAKIVELTNLSAALQWIAESTNIEFYVDTYLFSDLAYEIKSTLGMDSYRTFSKWQEDHPEMADLISELVLLNESQESWNDSNC